MIRPPRQRETSSPAPGTVPVVLSIAGSDNSGGAGIQADLKTWTTLGVYGTTAVTCVVAEHPGRVLNITPIPPARVADQIRLVLEAFPVAAIKTGMLYSAEIIAAVAKAVIPALARGVPLIVDPVMVASTGRVLLKQDAIRMLRKFIACATIVTRRRSSGAGRSRLWRRSMKRRSISPSGFVAPTFWQRAAISARAWRSMFSLRRTDTCIGSGRSGFRESIPTVPAAPIRRRLPPGWPRD